jgi:DNA polymerase-4
VGVEDTFPFDLVNREDMEAELIKLSTTLHHRLVKHQLKGKTITLKIRYADFRRITRSLSFETLHDEQAVLFRTARELLEETLPAEKGIRLLGITVSNFTLQTFNGNSNDPIQLKLDI